MTKLSSVSSLFTGDNKEEIMQSKILREDCPKYFNFSVAQIILTISFFPKFILLLRISLCFPVLTTEYLGVMKISQFGIKRHHFCRHRDQSQKVEKNRCGLLFSIIDSGPAWDQINKLGTKVLVLMVLKSS